MYKSMYVSTVYNNKVCDGGGDGCGQVLANCMTPVYSFKQCQDTDPQKQTINSEVLCSVPQSGWSNKQQSSKLLPAANEWPTPPTHTSKNNDLG